MTDENTRTQADASSTAPQPDQPAGSEPAREADAPHGVKDSGLSPMMRAIKYELEEKDMGVTVKDDGDILSAEKFDATYEIHADGTVEGSGVLADPLERKVEKIMGEQTPDEESSSESEDKAEAGKVEDNEPELAETTDSSEETTKAEPSVETEESTRAEAEADDAAEETTATNSDTDDDTESESLPEGTPSLFEASIEAGSLRDAMDTIHAIVDECRLHFCNDGLVIRAVDPANVAMVDESIGTDAFKSYETDCGEIGINLERVMEVVGIADDSETLVQFNLNPEVRKLEMQVGSVEYTLALIDPDSIRMEPDIPELDLPAEVSVDSAEFKRGIRAGDMVSDHLRYRVDPQAEQFITAADGDTDDVNLELGEDDLEDVEWGAADSLFSLDYLKDLRKPIPKETTLLMQLGEEFPLKISLTMADGAVEVTYMLAPRISSD